MTLPSENSPNLAGPAPRAITDNGFGARTMGLLSIVAFVMGLITGFTNHGDYGSVLGGRDPRESVGSGVANYQLVMSAPTTWTWLFLGAGVLMLTGAMHAAAVNRP